MKVLSPSSSVTDLGIRPLGLLWSRVALGDGGGTHHPARQEGQEGAREVRAILEGPFREGQ